MSQPQFTQLCRDCQFETRRERTYALSGYAHMRGKGYEELAYKSKKELYKETVRAIRRKNSINFLIYLFLRKEINRIAQRVVDWIIEWFPKPPK